MTPPSQDSDGEAAAALEERVDRLSVAAGRRRSALSESARVTVRASDSLRNLNCQPGGPAARAAVFDSDSSN